MSLEPGQRSFVCGKKIANKNLVYSIVVVFNPNTAIVNPIYLLTMNQEKAKISQSTIQLPFLLYNEPKLPSSQKMFMDRKCCIQLLVG
jgi:hypothetical protein